MQTFPSLYTLGCHISEVNRQVGGLWGYSLGKVMRALKKPPSLGRRRRRGGRRRGEGEKREGHDSEEGKNFVNRARSWFVAPRCGNGSYSLIGVRRSHDRHLPFKDVRVVHQTGRKALYRVFHELCKGDRGKAWELNVNEACEES